MEHFHNIEIHNIPRDICLDLMKTNKEYLEFDSEMDKFYLTEKGESVVMEFLQNLANLG